MITISVLPRLSYVFLVPVVGHYENDCATSGSQGFRAFESSDNAGLGPRSINNSNYEISGESTNYSQLAFVLDDLRIEVNVFFFIQEMSQLVF